MNKVDKILKTAKIIFNIIFALMLIATLITSVVFYRMFFPSPIFENVDVI